MTTPHTVVEEARAETIGVDAPTGEKASHSIVKALLDHWLVIVMVGYFLDDAVGWRELARPVWDYWVDNPIVVAWFVVRVLVVYIVLWAIWFCWAFVRWTWSKFRPRQWKRALCQKWRDWRYVPPVDIRALLESGEYIRVKGIAVFQIERIMALSYTVETVPKAALKSSNCPRCCLAAYSLFPNKDFERLLSVISKGTKPRYHKCPFAPGGEMDFAELIYVATYVALFRYSLGEVSSPYSLTPDREGDKKGKGKASRNDFSSDGWEQRARDDPDGFFRDLQDTVDDLYQQRSELLAYGEGRADTRAVMYLEDRISRLTGSMRAFGGEQEAQEGSRGKAINKGIQRVLGKREGKETLLSVFYSDDEELRKIPEKTAIERHAADMEASLATHEAHRAEVDRRDAMAENKVVQEAASKARKRPKKTGPRFESMQSCSVVYEHGVHSALLVFGTQYRNALMTRENEHLVLVTCRHGPAPAGSNRKCIDDPPPLDTIMVYPYGRPALRAQITSRWAPSSGELDEVWCKTNVLISSLPWKFKSPVFAKPDEEGAAIHTSVQIASGSYDFALNQVIWRTTHGVVVAKRDDHIGYNASTQEGFCRAPVILPNSKVIGGHLYGSLSLGRLVYNGAPFYAKPPAGNQYTVGELPPFDPEDLLVSRQGKIVARPGLPHTHVAAYRMMDEKYKIYPLRQDVNLKGVRTKYHLMRPSTALNHAEVQRYGDTLEYKTKGGVTWKNALIAAVLMDEGAMSPFVTPDEWNVRAMVEALDKDDKNAGFTGENMSHAQYISHLGEGDRILGRELLVERVLCLYRALCGSTDEKEKEILWSARHWMVMGKKDGYKAAKLDVGRTIQCPTLEMKILWKVCYGRADEVWCKRPHSWVHAGIDFDKAVRGVRREKILRSVGAGALDATAFDRYMEKEYIRTFFTVHLKELAPGAPQEFLDNMADYVMSGPMVMTDGTVYFKDRGNPSGFMNTLRLNCWANLVAWAYVVGRRLEDRGLEVTGLMIQDVLENHIYVEICGDDSRLWALTDFGAEILDLANNMAAVLTLWNEELPWSVKLEGCATWSEGIDVQQLCEMAPSMVSRRLKFHNNILWEPIVNVSRVLKRLVHFDGRTPEEEKELVHSAFATLAIPLHLHRQGRYWNSALTFLVREFATDEAWTIAENRAGSLMRQQD